MANNRIEIKSYEQSELVKLHYLKEITLENNPCAKDKLVFLKNIMRFMPGLKLIDGKTPTIMQESLKKDSSE